MGSQWASRLATHAIDRTPTRPKGENENHRRIRQVVASLRNTVSYCHQCGKNLSGHWSSCPGCREDKEGKSQDKGKKILEDFAWLLLTFCLLIFVAIISGEMGDPDLFFVVLALFLLIYIANIVAFSTKDIAGDSSDGRGWIRIRFLFMNGFAIIATSVGTDSIVMNHIIFWCVLILGGLIWAIPSKK